MRELTITETQEINGGVAAAAIVAIVMAFLKFLEK